jgi:sulfite exporter TauE/SafE
MNLALPLAALAMGVAGAPHCMAMCAAPCAAIVRSCGGSAPARAQLAWHVARVVSYAVGGAIAATGVVWLGEAARHTAVLRPLWGMFHVAALMLGIWLVWRGRQPAWLDRLGRVPGTAAGSEAPVAWLRGPVRAAAVGSLWVALPCGLLQSALVLAALGSSAAEGALVMVVFAAASGVGLWLGPAAWWRLAGGAGRTDVWQRMAIRISGALLVAASGWALWHGLTSRFAAEVCL